MQSIDFIPKIFEERPCCPCCLFLSFDEKIIIDNADTVKERMQKWIKIKGNKITIKNIETLDFRLKDNQKADYSTEIGNDDYYIIEKSHYRVWYTENIENLMIIDKLLN